MVCQDGQPNPNILAVSGDSCRLAFVGPSKCMVTIVESASLDEVSVGPLGQGFACLGIKCTGIGKRLQLLRDSSGPNPRY